MSGDGRWEMGDERGWGLPGLSRFRPGVTLIMTSALCTSITDQVPFTLYAVWSR